MYLGFLIVLFTIITSSVRCQEAIEISHFDLNLKDNLLRHRTWHYKQNDKTGPWDPVGPSIVLRRGETFDVSLYFRQIFNPIDNRLRVEFSTGPEPRLDKGTLLYLPVEVTSNLTEFKLNSGNYINYLTAANSGTSSVNGWSCKGLENGTNKLDLSISIPHDAGVGVWRMKLATKAVGGKNLRTYAVNQAIYIIFNAWNKHDDVYMEREDAKREYLLNEVGKIYIGDHTRPQGKRWDYTQFHNSVLPATMYLLEQTRLDIKDRSSPVKVARAISAVINANDEGGLLVGNWSGNYANGISPWRWTSSHTVFERYLQQGCRSVRFGQCWVFGGLTTTALRTVGIPARTISNFVSAHDTDLSLSIDEFYSETGRKLEGINGDSIWNFHCWSDAWMARYDLPPGFGGWQAVDATPQEQSMGRHQLGPASLEAIKQGRTDFAYDTGFVFTEVNADTIKWSLTRGFLYQWRRHNVNTAHVGRKMLTKMIGVLDERSYYKIDDAENIVHQYKFPEGSIEERKARADAVRLAGLGAIYNQKR